jgi:hypothetical protein
MLKHFAEFLLVFSICPSSIVYAQTLDSRKTLDKNFYQRLVVNNGETLSSSVDSIYVDTLILNDESTILFQVNSILIVENAFIGQQCVLSSAGRDGNKPGASGIDGSDLQCIMIFRKLESLKIVTRGGDGMQGSRGIDGGRIGTNGNNGGPGKSGGHGGNGGNLKLAYMCDGFVPAINTDGPHRIEIVSEGGLAAEGGKGGSPGKPIRPYKGYGRQGKDGENGIPGRGGYIEIVKIPH